MNDKIEILLGDNPFFGIDHLSQDRARKRMEILKGLDKIIEIIQFSLDSGIKGFVVSTHPQLKDLIDRMKENTNILEKLHFYPILPYAQGYVAKVTEKGMVGAMNDILSGSTTQDKMKILLKGSIGYLTKDYEKLLQTFIDIELTPLMGIKKQTVFLHDVITDLAMSLEMKDIISLFINYTRKKYGVEVGLVTKNFPKLVQNLKNWNINIPTIMTSFNSIGNQMNPSREECEVCLLNNNVDLIAMNVLAGGLLKPVDAAKYVSSLNIRKLVIGMSTKEHVSETIHEFRS